MRNLILAALVALTPVAASASSHEGRLPMVDGEVRKVDKKAAELTLKHKRIPNLDMPEMTMPFRVRDVAMLDRVKAGDKVRFAAEKVGGQFTVTSVEVVK